MGYDEVKVLSFEYPRLHGGGQICWFVVLYYRGAQVGGIAAKSQATANDCAGRFRQSSIYTGSLR